MLSDEMEKSSIIVGKHCLEQSNMILALCSKYTMITTDIASAASKCIYSDSVQTVKLSSEEICEYYTFFNEHKCLSKIGFSEGTLLFLSLRRKCKVATVDDVTKKVCRGLGVEIFNVVLSGCEEENTGNLSKNSRVSRLPDFMRVAACL